MAALPGQQSSRLARGLEWASIATTIGLEFALPCMLGFAIDRRFGIRPAGTLIGAILGFVMGMTHTIRLGQVSSSKPDSNERRKPS